jgi:hypothetical protein
VRCGPVRARLSGFLDGALFATERRDVAAHLGRCRSCAAVWQGLQSDARLLAELPRLEPGASVAEAVTHQLEVESRGPGLQMIFRSPWRARPMILPAVAPATVVFAALLSVAVVLDRGSSPPSRSVLQSGSWHSVAPSGTEGNPLFPSADVSAPRLTLRGTIPMPPADASALTAVERSVFLETVVARDGRVSAVVVLDGEAEPARLLAEAVRRERFEPALRRGRPVAVSMYRLFSLLEVHATTADGA